MALCSRSDTDGTFGIIGFDKGVRRVSWLPSCQAVNLPSCLAVTLSSCQSVNLSSCQAVTLSSCPAVQLSSCQTFTSIGDRCGLRFASSLLQAEISSTIIYFELYNRRTQQTRAQLRSSTGICSLWSCHNVFRCFCAAHGNQPALCRLSDLMFAGQGRDRSGSKVDRPGGRLGPA